MTVQISNTNINDSFNSWRLNTNLMATVISNNVVTVSRQGSANRGGAVKGNGHVSGTFSATNLRTTKLQGGNTTSSGNWLEIASNTSINATSLTVTANTTFQGNVDFVTSGADRLVLGDISRVRVTGGSQGQFLRIEGESDTPNFKSLTLRDIVDLSSNSANIVLSGANTTFSDNNDSVNLIFTNGTDRAMFFMASDATIGDSDVFLKLVDADGDSRFVVADSGNNVMAYIDSDGQIVSSSKFLPSADDTVDLGSSGAEFKDLYLDGVAYIDELSVATGASQGVSTSLIPKTDAAGNLGSTTRKWGTVWADTTNGGAGVFKTLGVSGALTVNGDITINSDNMTLDGNTVIGDASTDTVTFTATVASDFDPSSHNSRDMGSNDLRWRNIWANNIVANTITANTDVTVDGDLTVNGTTTIASGQGFTADTGTFTTLNVTGATTLDGSVDLGDASVDTISFNGTVDTDVIPTGTRNLGSLASQWNNIWINGTASIDVLSVDETVTVAGDVTLNGDNLTVAGNTVISDALDVGDSIDVTNAITNDGTVMLGKNAKLHANNTISDQTITTAMLTQTGTPTGVFGNSSVIPIVTVGVDGRITDISNTVVAGVTALTYTQSNNNIRISTADGSTFDDVIESATTTSGTGRGVASFDSGDFGVSSGHVTLANSVNGAVLALNATANETTVSRTNGIVTIGLPEDVTITSDLMVGGGVFVSGNLVVSGTTTTVNTETIDLADNIITLNSNHSGAPSQNGGILINRGTSANAQLQWNETGDVWEVGTHGGTFYDILLNDGTYATNTHVNTVAATKMSVANTQSLVGARLGATATVQITGAVAGGPTAFSANAVSIAVTQQNDSVTLGTHTTGNYVATITNGTGISGSSSTEGGTPTIALSHLGLEDLTDPDGDRIAFWDDSAGAFEWLSIGSNLTLTGTTLSADAQAPAAGAGIDVSGTTVSVESDLRGDVTQLGFSTSDYYKSLASSHEWYTDGDLDMRLNSSGDLDVEGDIIAQSTSISSDERLKDNITPVANALDKVLQLNGVEFTWKKNGELSAGVIAQDVEKVLPQAVKEVEELNGNDTYKTVKYDALHALLIESIKELKAEIDELKKNK